MITLNQEIPNNFFVLDRCETIGGYARLYGNQVTDRYEAFDIIYIPHFPLEFDLQLFQHITMPDSYAKMGTVSGIEETIITRKGREFEADNDHALNMVTNDPKLAIYLQNQILSVNWQIRCALNMLLPSYHSMQEGNITWRLTEVKGDGLHFDYYHDENDKPFPFNSDQKSQQKVKLFINIDKEERIWHTSMSLPEFLRSKKDLLPDTLPGDLNLLNAFISTGELLKKSSFHTVKIPPLAAVLVNASAVSHHIEFGRKMIGAEFSCHKSDMRQPESLMYDQLPRWLGNEGYKIKQS